MTTALEVPLVNPRNNPPPSPLPGSITWVWIIVAVGVVLFAAIGWALLGF